VEPVAPAPREPSAAPERAPEVSWDTERDHTFARFLQQNTGGMVRKAAVGLEKRGELKVEIDRSVAPDDTLPLTRSLLAGARKDFPDRPIHLSLYDPTGAPILRASYRPGRGVHYQIAQDGTARTEPGTQPETAEASKGKGQAPVAEALARSGVTERDRKFAAWAEEHGRAYLRYVEADLERSGRLWFGVTANVKPEDVRPLAQSLLEGARKEFPDRVLVATVFDPEGERIGRARLGRDGKIGWER